MVIRKTTQRDERRRRVLVDERILTPSRPSTPTGGSEPRTAKRTRRYAEAASAKNQPRVSSFIPTRPWTVSVWFLAGLAFVTAHATLYALTVQYAPPRWPIDLSPIRLEGPGSIANWSSSSMLLLAALVATLIVQFRRHRLDDYRGEYRVWYYVLVGLVVASISSSTGSLHILRQATDRAAESFEIQRASLWINGLASICVTCLAVRIVLEVRGSRATVAVGALAAVAYLCHILLAAGILPIPSGELHLLASGVARLSGHYLLLMSLIMYSRYVFLDAQGLIQHAAKRKKSSRKQRSKQNAGRTAKAMQTARSKSQAQESKKENDSQTVTAEPSSARSVQAKGNRAKSKPAVSAEERQTSKTSGAKTAASEPIHEETTGEELDSDPATIKMNKAERRRTRKQRKRDRRAA